MARKLKAVKKNEDAQYYQDLKDRTEPTIHLIDGNNWGNRAYFAVMGQNKTDKKGRQVGGVANFCSMIKAHINAVERNANGVPQYHVIGFDPHTVDTWRYRMQAQWVKENPALSQELFSTKLSPQYKGNRDKTKYPDVGWQVDQMRDILEANGFCILRKRAYEADDILGAMARRFAPKCHVDLYTVDKDYLQLLTIDNARVIMPEQANRAARVYTADNAHELFGVNADQMIDFLAMCGDTADNVLGLTGVGEGTASKLLKEWGSLDNIIQNINNIKGSSRWIKILRGEIDHMPMDMMVELVTIDRLVPGLPRKVRDLVRKDPDMARIRKMNKLYGFNTEIKLAD